MYLVILQTQSTGGAALEIIVMLLGAAIIGVLTTYFFMKSRYQQTIKELQSKLVEAERSKDRLNEELMDARKQLDEKNRQYSELDKKYNDLLQKEESLKKAAAAGKEASKKLHDTELELEEKEALLKRISERKHMIDYSRIGTARKEDANDLKLISGIGPFIEERLHTLDIYTYEQISKFTREDEEAVTEAIEFFPGRIERDDWVGQAKKLAGGGGA
jgi:predicted flap endonuclease-1-like 5' DNA nuclease